MAEPLGTPTALPLRVDLDANGTRLGSVDYGGGPQRAALPLGAVARDRHLSLTWHISHPRAPRDCGLSDDRRPLGLFFRSVVVT